MATLVSVAVDPPAGTVAAGDSLEFDAVGTYDDASTRELTPSEVTFTTSNPTVATVGNSDNNYGLVYGLEPGTATLTATATTGPTATAAVTVTDIPDDAGTAPQARFSLAFGSATLDAYPNWTAIDDYPNLVTSYSIDRGRDYELDQFDTGTATVQILDPEGILDPTNPEGPFYGLIRPLLRAAICRRNPVTNTWRARYSGWVDEYSYEIDPSQLVNRLTITLVDLFELCSSAELQPGAWGTNTDHGNIEYPSAPADVRIRSVLRELRVPDRLSSLLYSPTIVQKTIYSPGESALTAIQEGADAEFPGVGNVFVDRIGRMCFHGRRGRFDPEGVSADAGDVAWNYHEWNVGDGEAVNFSPADTAQVRALTYSRGLSKIINSAVATPQGASDSEIQNQRVTDTQSIGIYGIRAWSATNLLTRIGDRDEAHYANALTETRRFARFFLHNYKQPRRRINEITFRSVEPEDPRAAANWELLCLVDVGDTVTVTVANPGGGGFSAEQYFVEGVHEEAKAGTPEYDDVTITLDLSPRSYYSYDPWASPLSADDATWTPANTSKSGKPKPTVHAGDHGHGSADPYEMQYENVGDPAGGGGNQIVPYSISGDLDVSNGLLRWYALRDASITEIWASVGTPG